MEKYSKILLAVGLGVMVSAIGVVLMGYVAAVTIPKEYFSWFQSSLGLQVAMTLLYAVQQIIGFGLLLFAAAYLVTRKLSLPPLLAIACLLIGFWFYSVVGVALVYNEPVGHLVSALHWSMVTLLIVHIACLALGAILGSRRRDLGHAKAA